MAPTLRLLQPAAVKTSVKWRAEARPTGRFPVDSDVEMTNFMNRLFEHAPVWLLWLIAPAAFLLYASPQLLEIWEAFCKETGRWNRIRSMLEIQKALAEIESLRIQNAILTKDHALEIDAAGSAELEITLRKIVCSLNQSAPLYHAARISRKRSFLFGSIGGAGSISVITLIRLINLFMSGWLSSPQSTGYLVGISILSLIGGLSGGIGSAILVPRTQRVAVFSGAMFSAALWAIWLLFSRAYLFDEIPNPAISLAP